MRNRRSTVRTSCCSSTAACSNVSQRRNASAGAGRTKCLRPTDTAAAPGGDEFAVWSEDTTDDVNVLAAAPRIIPALQLPSPPPARKTAIGASVGIASPTPGVTVDELLRNA